VITILLTGTGLLLLLSAAAVILSGRQDTLLQAAGLAVSVLLLACSLAALIGNADQSLLLPLGLPWLGAHLRVDPLAAFFLSVVNLGAAAAFLYGLDRDRHGVPAQRVLPFLPAFIAGMNLVLLADDAFSFLFSWELMSLASWVLVLAHHREQDNLAAGRIYLIMASGGTMALLFAFGLMAGAAGDYNFASIRGADFDGFTAAAVFGLMVLGAGSKAGVVPLHVWLPLAHPAAPSQVSALMSGVMTKVAIYGFLRVVFDLVGVSSGWASIVLLVLGALTAAIGILHALMESDLKRLLACSTIENVGIIFISLGLVLAFQAYSMDGAAALALSAALFHVLNHSLFKPLLFLGAGAVLSQTGTRDLERLGGLIHLMPATAVLFLVGSFAISALPPLNGFVSEWLAFQAVLQSPLLPDWGLKIVVPAAGAVLAMAAALAATVFVRAFGTAFLGRPRSDAAAQASDAGPFAIAAMAMLAVLCLLAGVFPGLVLHGMLMPVTTALIGAPIPEAAANGWLLQVPTSGGVSSYSGLLVLLFAALVATLAAALVHRFASRRLRRGPAWGCGFPPVAAAQMSAASFAQPLRRIFGTQVFSARERVFMPPPGSLETARIEVTLRDPAWDWLYRPPGIAVARAAQWLNRFQFLTIRRYLAFVFVVLVFMLTVLALWT